MMMRFACEYYPGDWDLARSGGKSWMFFNRLGNKSLLVYFDEK
jgi:hypothetical protein